MTFQEEQKTAWSLEYLVYINISFYTWYVEFTNLSFLKVGIQQCPQIFNTAGDKLTKVSFTSIENRVLFKCFIFWKNYMVKGQIILDDGQKNNA